MVRWEIPLPQNEPTNSIEAYQHSRDDIKRRLEDLFAGGCLAALMAVKKNNEVILDHFTEGVIVHDVKRTILCFNRAAEEITGISRGRTRPKAK